MMSLRGRSPKQSPHPDGGDCFASLAMTSHSFKKGRMTNDKTTRFGDR